MSGFRPYVLVALTVMCYMAPGFLSAQARVCPDNLPSPDVSVEIKEADPRFETAKSATNLKNLAIDSHLPYPSQYHDTVGGATDAAIHLDHKIKYQTADNERLDVSCLWFTGIHVTLRLHPKIYIADEADTDSCWYREIFAHEVRHIEADRQVLNEHAELIKQGLALVFRKRGDYVSGVVDQSELDQRFAKMKWTVRESLGVLFEVMMRDRAKRHLKIDSGDNYQEVGKKCGRPFPG